MNTDLKDRDPKAETTATIPQIVPKDIGYGHPEYQFVQSIMEMQKSLGEINASIKSLNQSVESTRSKVDDLIKWKNMIIGGAAAIGFILGIIAIFATKIDHIAIKSAPSSQISQPSQPEKLIKNPASP